MLKNILVPLDGSRLAEAAIAPAAVLCEKTGAQVTLMHLIEKNAPQAVHGQTHLTTESEAGTYLERIAKEYFDPKIQVATHIHAEEVSLVAVSIVEHSQEYKVDLIILCAHGESIIHNFVVGSIPQQVITSGAFPVLLLQPELDEHQKIKLDRFLVALYGEPDHDTSLVFAADLAYTLKAGLHLIRVVPTLSTLRPEHAASGTLLPSATNAILEIAEEEACEYLQEKLVGLNAKGIAVTAEVKRGDPAAEVVKSAENQNVDMIVLGTHGKKGLHAFWAGSVAPQIVSRTHLPILLVPVSG